MAAIGRVSLIALLVLAADALRADVPKSFLAHDGHAWRALSEGEKLALLTGFLIGGAFEHGIRLAPGEAGPAAETLEAMRQEGRLRFPYTPAVYKARIEDFYFYQDRLPVPLYRALHLINEQIRQGSRPAR
ncbi:MAG: hypothetical protein ACRELA_17935 [Candidatus Rokuibacteriota bacterium]